MERIFGEHSLYSQDTQDALRQVMLAQTQEKTDMRIYGKTGMGKSDGVVVDAWYTGFAEMQEGPCVFLRVFGRDRGRRCFVPKGKGDCF